MTDPGAQLDLIDPHGLAEQAGRRATIAEIAAAGREQLGKSNTREAFKGDWKLWLAYCEMAQRDGHDNVLPYAVDSDNLQTYAMWLARGGLMPDGTIRKSSAPETIRRRLTGVLAGWRKAKIEPPRGITKDARDWVNGYEAALIKAKHSTGRGQAIPLRVEEIHRIAATTDTTTLAGLRDMAVVTLDFSIGGRRSELAALDVSDITVQGDGMEVHVRDSKTGARKPWVPYGEYESTCPVRCWLRWQQRSAIITGGALRRVTRYDTLGRRLSGAAVSEVIARAGVRAKLDGRRTGHSVRRGFATEAAARGRPKRKIADQGGWLRTSSVLERYIDDAEKRTDNVLKGMGL